MMGRISDWLREHSTVMLVLAAVIVPLLAILGSIFGSTAYIVSELRQFEDGLLTEMRAIGVPPTSGDAQLREDIRNLEAKTAANDVQLREEIRAGDAELRLSLENLSNQILAILSGAVNRSTGNPALAGPKEPPPLPG